MNKTQTNLITIINHALHGNPLPQSFLTLPTEEKERLLQFSGKQGVLPFLQCFPDFQGKNPEIQGRFRNMLMTYVYQDALLAEGMKLLLNTFEAEGIFCVPLKGIRTKSLYPSSELRSMGDLDILYKKEQTQKLQKVMADLGYQWDGEAAKHDHYQKGDMIVEMHRELLSAESRAYEYFHKIWERVRPVEGKNYVCEMTLEDHYLFTLYHLIEHFIRGGIGIRMVLDIYIIYYMHDLDREYLRREIGKLQIEEFERNIRLLSLRWFGTEEEREAAQVPEDFHWEELENYIVGGGVFGSKENEVINDSLRSSGGWRYLFHVAFPSYSAMQTVFSWLKTPLLLPAAWTVRAWNVLTKRRENLHLQTERAREIRKLSGKKRDEQSKFLARWGL